MKKKALKYYVAGGLIFAFIVLIIVFWKPLSTHLVETNARSNEPVLGFFDRNSASNEAVPINVIHYKVTWKRTALWADQHNIEEAIASHDVLLTIETWPSGFAKNENVLTSILNGAFDKEIAGLGRAIAHTRHQAYIRLNPDMEVPVTKFPWQFQSPPLYIQSFNYFVEKIKQYAPNAKIVWGPSGYPGDTEYWPGNKNVDFVSITLGSASELSADKYQVAPTIPAMLRQKLHRLRFIDKPVMILGADKNSKEKFEPGWLDAQLADMDKFANTIYSPRNFTDSSNAKPERKRLEIGVFDPGKKLVGQHYITTEHIFTDWGEVQRGDFEKRFREIISRKHDPIVTMEPWRDTSRVADTNVTASILKGRYDDEIAKLFQIISSTKQIVYLRFMHEMEIPIHRYPWQSQDPVAYINAYRYFMQFEGGPGKNVKKVWGPAGDRGSVDFWPGDDVVDYISIAIYGLPDKNITDPNKQEAFSTIFNRKYYRMRFLSKPLFITEMGVKGDESYQDKWLRDAAATIKSNPHIFGVCYFNLYDNPKAWGHIKAPDWSITPASMNKFYRELNKQ